jgi:hypothetical protein
LLHLVILLKLCFILNLADPHSKDVTGATPLDYIVKRNLVFCNSIVDLCLRKDDKKMSKVK